jgi:hypothetical protein
MINFTFAAEQNNTNLQHTILGKNETELIKYELLDKTEHSEFYTVNTSKTVVNILSKHEGSKISLGYDGSCRFLYETQYITIINKEPTDVKLQFITDVDAKTIELNKSVVSLKVNFDDSVKKLSLRITDNDGNTLFEFQNITVLHKTYESYITEEKDTFTIKKGSFYTAKMLFFIGGIIEAFAVVLILLWWFKKRKEDTIIVGWL